MPFAWLVFWPLNSFTPLLLLLLPLLVLEAAFLDFQHELRTSGLLRALQVFNIRLGLQKYPSLRDWK